MHPAPHLASHPSYSQDPPSAPLGHYQQYQQGPVLPQGSGHYGPPQPYGSYGYANGVTSPQSVGGPVGQQNQSQIPPLPGKQTGRWLVGQCTDTDIAMIPGPGTQHSYVPQTPTLPTPTQSYPPQQPFDTTGQVAPPGMKPRVTATLWEDEGSLCFQVEAKGVCVARREGEKPTAWTQWDNPEC
jgi:protein SOK2